MRYIRKPKDFYFGLIFLSGAVLLLLISRNYSFGSARQMGPGYFPVMLCIGLIGLSLILMGRSFFGEVEPLDGFGLKPLALVLSGSLVFGLLIRPVGLVAATMATVIIGALAGQDSKPLQTLVLAAVLAGGSVLLFVYGLGQPIPILGTWFD